jgi:hypothetical protein
VPPLCLIVFHSSEKMQIPRRLGTFFTLIGLVLLVLYVGSVISSAARTSYLLVAIVALLAGILLQRNKPTGDSGRFSALRRASAATRQRREERLNEKSKK